MFVLVVRFRSAKVPFTKVKKLLGSLVGSDRIIDSYITIGPFPGRQDVLLDIFVLCSSCLYNVDARVTGILCHRLLLANLTMIEERPALVSGARKQQDYICYNLRTGIHEVMIFDKVSRRDNTEKFCSKIKDAAVAIQESNR